MKVKNYLGFSLIELVISIAVLAVLASISIYTYSKNQRKTMRGEAIFRMLGIQSDLERRYAHMGKYVTGYTIPNTKYYSYTIAITDTTYTITATARPAPNPQLNDREGSTSCAILTLDTNSTKTPSICWAQ